MADKHRSEMNFEVGMKVYIKLQPYRQSTVRQRTHHKFSTKYYGSYVVIAKVGKVAYKLPLPPDSQIHPVFHVSQLKLCKGTNHQVGVLPLCGTDGVLSVELKAIIGRRLGKLNNKPILYVLVKWVNQTEEEATWELYTDLLQRQSIVRQRTHHKFATKYYGPFVVIAKVGKVAQLPPDSQIHPVFHVSQLKLCKGTNHQVGVLPLCGTDGVLSMELKAIIGRRLGKLNNKPVLYVLVK
nr:gypsy/Ty3 retroelement polyprotein [Tanacetum cinerariifolium]